MRHGAFVVVLAILFLSVSALAAMADSGPGPMHVVQPGDTLASIAGRYCTTWQELYNLNASALVNPDQLYPGMTLRVVSHCGGEGGGGWPGEHGGPGGGQCVSVYDRGPRLHAQGYLYGNSYAVVWGDTAYSISQRFGITVDALGKANGINPWRIYAGQRLTIPGLGQGGYPSSQPQRPYDGQPRPPGPNPPRP